MSEKHAAITEQHRKLALEIARIAGFAPIVDWPPVAQLLADHDAKEAERVRRETLEEAAQAKAIEDYIREGKVPAWIKATKP